MDGQLIFSEADGEFARRDLAMCERVLVELNRHYPGHPWLVNVSHKGGSVGVKLCYFDRLGRFSRLGYWLPLTLFASELGWREVMLAGGELLERYGLPRAAYRQGDRQRAEEHGLDATGRVDAR